VKYSKLRAAIQTPFDIQFARMAARLDTAETAHLSIQRYVKGAF
jgi:hypothetical protein